MEEYKDEDTTNWIYRNDTKTAATASFTFNGNPTAGAIIGMTSSNGSAKSYIAKAAGSNGDSSGGKVVFLRNATPATVASNLQSH